jgi:hypothetical protein
MMWLSSSRNRPRVPGAHIVASLRVLFTEPRIRTVRGSHFADVMFAIDRRCTHAFVTPSYSHTSAGDGERMAYVPDWETLAETLARVMKTTGLSTSEAQLDICRAFRDGKLRSRYTVERVQTPYGVEVNRQAFGKPRSPFDQRDIIGRPRIPPDLNPDDIDWVNSRPKSPWLDNRRFLVGIAKIELSTTDVIRVLCRGRSAASRAQASIEQSPPEKGIDARAPIAPAKEKVTTGDEMRAMKLLEAQLKTNPKMSVSDAKTLCSENGPPLGDRPFRRVWRNARIAAGLTPTADRGRKPKSLR